MCFPLNSDGEHCFMCWLATCISSLEKCLLRWSAHYLLTLFLILSCKCSLFPSWITALLWQRGLHNSMRLWVMLFKVTNDGWIIVKSSDKMGSTGGRNGNLPGEPHDWYEKAKRYDSRRWAPSSEGIQYATGEAQRAILIASGRVNQLGQSRNDTQLWMRLVVKVKPDAVRKNIA